MSAQLIKCAIYARVSTDRQGDSIENQVGQCTEYIKRLGDNYDYNNIAVYRDEAVSGYYTSVFDREEMKKAIQDAKNDKFKLLVFKEISRVGRDKMENPAIIGMFEQYGVRVIAINDNYDSLNKDNITFDILSVLSEQESKKISVRVSSARKQKASRGQWSSEPPIGYKVNPQTKRLEVDDKFAKIPQEIFELYANKGLGTFKIAEHLNHNGYRTKNGNLWSRESVNRVLRNQAYIGQVVHGTRRNKLKREYDDTGKMSKRMVQIKIDRKDWQVVDEAHPSLIEKEIFYKAQKILLSRTHGRSPRRAYHPLTGILYCKKCGEGMVCQKRTHKNKEYRYYICKTYHKFGRSVCSQANINADTLEKTVYDIIRNRIKNLPADFFEVVANNREDITRLKHENIIVKKEKEKLIKDQMDIFSQRELFPEEVYKNQMLEIKSRILKVDEKEMLIQKQIEHLEEKSEESSSLQYIFHEFNNLKIEEVDNLRGLFHSIIDKIEYNEGEVTLNYIYNLEMPQS